MHEVLVNRLGGLSLPRKSVVRLTDRPDMTLDVYRGHKTTTTAQQEQQQFDAIQFVRSSYCSNNVYLFFVLQMGGSITDINSEMGESWLT